MVARGTMAAGAWKIKRYVWGQVTVKYDIGSLPCSFRNGELLNTVCVLMLSLCTLRKKQMGEKVKNNHGSTFLD